jgi:hypothetical protein
MNENFDAIVIGTGQSGPSLAVRLAGAGRQVAIVERKHYGGTCVNDGCMPTKTLVASAYAAHLTRTAGNYGVLVEGSIKVDMKRVKARKDEVVGRATRGVEHWLKNTPGLTVLEGQAVASAHSIEVNEHSCGQTTSLSMPAAAHWSQIFLIEQVPYLTNSTMMEVDFARASHHRRSYITRICASVSRFGESHIVRFPRLIGAKTTCRVECCRFCATRASSSSSALNVCPLKTDKNVAVTLDCAGDARRSSVLPFTCQPRPTRTIWGWNGPNQSHERGYIVVDDRPDHRSRCLGLRLYAVALLRIPRTTTTRSSPPICWMAASGK